VSVETESAETTRYDKVYPNLGTGPVPAGPCLDPDYYELERKRLFARTWLYFGRAEPLSKPGAFRVKNYEVCNAEVLVTRARDGELRAFHNMCPHRGRQLTQEESGSCRAFTCNFHGWTFDPDGSLRNVPAEEKFFDFDRRDYGLKPIAIDVWEGFIFISFAQPPMQTLEEFLGDWGDGMKGYPFQQMTESFRYSATYKANWKVTLDAFQEFYHVRTVHKHSLGKTVRGPRNENSYTLDIQLHPLHRLISGYGNPEYVPSPVEIAAFTHGKSIAQQFGGGQEANDLLPRGVNPTKAAEWSFDINVVFPNVIVDVLDGMYFTQEFWPVAVDEVYHEVNMYFPPPTSAAELFSRHHSAIELRDSILEDGSNIEPVQTALSKSQLTHLVLQDEEIAVRHSYRVVNEFVYSDDPYSAAVEAVSGGAR
jgi:phenylpropionate dioxygenase-like ring-hydroxylating dioxygenase large terminal subunit